MNGAVIRELINSAARQAARVINFCEGALSGYAKPQIGSPDRWRDFDWDRQEAELRSIAEVCRQLRIFAVVGAAHRLSGGYPPHNSLYVFADDGRLLTRYDKRYLSNSELGGWYTPGVQPITFEVDGHRFGCAVCIECQFPEVFAEYERLGVDAVLFSSYGIPPHFQIALQAHAGLNCLWIAAATPAQKAHKGVGGMIGPDGQWINRCSQSLEPSLAIATLDRADPAYEVPLQKARPWRARARQGEIYREKMVNDLRSLNRSRY
ncbi:carbon-nitrogen hydrolase family protein [Sinorhizobium terangae]|uniref:carbon-nitrogen hydrolase family protein n=1 Tax=Sinorhizobium terangae TaxID=110322 RepID=UPI0018309327|nr:carbon-nitrogen hydrolase family protein [Sinorhizobium terangae]MBB4186741.1 putative amidohydrolase [Sinorhizobium terangae]WFU47424.1 carbon-nitrogen hydrolase family protein [Sinorhizobium terangae]